jgi:hypothetical protein
MKYSILFFLLLSVSLNSFSQFNKNKSEPTQTDKNVKKTDDQDKSISEEEWVKGFDKSKFIYGGGLTLNFGNPTYLGASPLIGYRFLPKLGIGISSSYLYYVRKLTDPNTLQSIKQNGHNLTIGAFSRYQIWQSFYASLEPEITKIWYKESGPNYHVKDQYPAYPSVLVGGGYIQRIGSRVGINVQVLYDVLQQNPLYYRMPVIRGGITAGF